MKMFSNSKPKVLVCVLTGIERHNWLCPELTQTILTMTKDPRFDVSYYPLKDARPVEHARNISVDLAKQMSADWLISFDNDNFPYTNPLDVIAAAGDKRVIGLSYATHNATGVEIFPPNAPGVMDGDFREVPHVGGGCLMIHKSVWQKFSGPYFRFVLPESYGDSRARNHPPATGEDVYFCTRARKHGFKVWTHRALAGHHRAVDLTRLLQTVLDAKKRP